MPEAFAQHCENSSLLVSFRLENFRLRKQCCVQLRIHQNRFKDGLLGRNGSISEPRCCLGHWEDPRLQNKRNLQPVDISVIPEVDLHRMEDSVEPPGLAFDLCLQKGLGVNPN